jgi:hypothetical protein
MHAPTASFRPTLTPQQVEQSEPLVRKMSRCDGSPCNVVHWSPIPFMLVPTHAVRHALGNGCAPEWPRHRAPPAGRAAGRSNLVRLRSVCTSHARLWLNDCGPEGLSPERLRRAAHRALRRGLCKADRVTRTELGLARGPAALARQWLRCRRQLQVDSLPACAQLACARRVPAHPSVPGNLVMRGAGGCAPSKRTRGGFRSRSAAPVSGTEGGAIDLSAGAPVARKQRELRCHTIAACVFDLMLDPLVQRT